MLRIPMRRKRGFSLIELMFVITLVGILLAIAIPAFTQARDKARTKTCMKNLSHIQTAKEQYAIVERKSEGDPVDLEELVPRYIRRTPECPADGDYEAERIGSPPTCTYEGHELAQ